MTEKDTHPAATHTAFPYYFSDVGGFHFGDLEAPVAPEYKYIYDLAIYYDSLTGNDYLDCKCSRWDVQDYSVVIETWLKKSDAQTLRSNVRPGAVGELYKLFDRPVYRDQTWVGANTLRLLPTPSSSKMNSSKLKSMRDETLIFVKNLSEHPITNSNWIEVKIEGYVSGTGAL